MKNQLGHKLAAACFALALGISAAVHAAAESGKPAGTEAAPADIVLKGDAKCTRCHDESWPKPVLSIGQTHMGIKGDSRTPTCTTCHGASEKHMAMEQPKADRTFGKDSTTPVGERNRVCLSCHQGGNRILWEGSQHASAGIACTNCHQVHTADDKVRDRQTQTGVCFTCHKDQRAQSHMTSTHPINAGKVVCSDCHNPHGSTGPKLLRENTVNETCYTCHAEKRGPFLWEHPPASDNCLNCHTPHGSNTAPLLKSRPPYLCQQCHSAQYHPSTAYSGTGLPITAGGTSPAQQLLLRACLNCHSQVHGTNHPSGPRYTR